MIRLYIAFGIIVAIAAVIIWYKTKWGRADRKEERERRDRIENDKSADAKKN